MTDKVFHFSAACSGEQIFVRVDQYFNRVHFGNYFMRLGLDVFPICSHVTFCYLYNLKTSILTLPANGPVFLNSLCLSPSDKLQ